MNNGVTHDRQKGIGMNYRAKKNESSDFFFRKDAGERKEATNLAKAIWH